MEPVVLIYVCSSQHVPGETERQQKSRAVTKPHWNEYFRIMVR